MLKKLLLILTLLSLGTLSLAACNTPPPLPTTGNISTICPAAGTARAAIAPALTLGNHANLIYYLADNSDPNVRAGLLKRTDITNQSSVIIARVLNADIEEAQVSTDGQWILFLIRIDSPHQHVELRLIRVDGQYQQTLFCLPEVDTPYDLATGHFQWSPDERSVAVVGESGQFALPATYIVNLVTGEVQLELASTVGSVQTEPNGPAFPIETEVYSPVKWLDNTRIYLDGSNMIRGNPQQASIYLLDTSKGANQHNADLQRIVSEPVALSDNSTSICGFDSSSDASQLFISRCTLKNGWHQGLSTITAQPATGGVAKTIFSTPTFAVTQIYAINPQTLLLLINNGAGDKSHNGLWKINTDGTGLTRLVANVNLSLCGYQEDGCSNISLDGTMYAVVAFASNGANTLYYGSLSGGAFHKIAMGDSLVGWTTF